MLSLVIDIRSDVVEGTLVSFPDILYSASIHVPHSPHTTHEHRVKTMLKSVEDTCKHVASESRHYSKEKIASIHYILSSPWVITQSKAVRVEYEKETVISDATIQAIMEENRQELLKTHEKDMIFIEQKIFSVELNGYHVQDYRGKRARTLQASFAFSLSSEKLLEKIRGAAAKAFHAPREEYYHSAILLHYLASREKVADDREYVLLHLHGELTDVAIVKKGTSAYLGSFPYGASTLLRKFSDTLGSTQRTAHSVLSLYEQKKLEEAEHRRVQARILPLLQEWQEGCRRSCEGLGEGVAVPRTMHVASDSPYKHLFEKSLDGVGFETHVDETPLHRIYVAALSPFLGL